MEPPALPPSPCRIWKISRSVSGGPSEDERYRHMAGEVLSDQTKPLVDHWRREIIGSIPNLIRHSRTPGGEPIPDYSDEKRPALRAMGS